jgi:hypothetical protein
VLKLHPFCWCVGSSLFLKAHFGVGYNIVMEKRGDCNEQKLETFVRSHVPVRASICVQQQTFWCSSKPCPMILIAIGSFRTHHAPHPHRVAPPDAPFCPLCVQEAKLLSNVGAEMSFQLPLTASSRFRGMFEELDADQEGFGIETYGMSVTTLEEVFIKVGYPTHPQAPLVAPSLDMTSHQHLGCITTNRASHISPAWRHGRWRTTRPTTPARPTRRATATRAGPTRNPSSSPKL